MKRIFWGATITIGIMVAAWIAASVPSRAADQVDRVARGKYLVEGIGCSDCHTPKKMGPQGMELDTTRLLAGHPEGTPLPEAPTGQSAWAIAATGDLTAWTGPWGVSYAANLTPDQNTGLGIWTE
ncbi:MAG TPA: diheme cytochrome c-553, partial [Dehalococcoidia bacterium]|nr:diheme cytochrome c-553 [Dehalococcoidia bacterium]